MWRTLNTFAETDCSHTPSDPEVLATANMNNCYQLVDRVAFGVGADPDRRDPPPDKQEVCLWLHKDDHCAHTDNAEVTMISVPLDGERSVPSFFRVLAHPPQTNPNVSSMHKAARNSSPTMLLQ